jgi:hypothetical protein
MRKPWIISAAVLATVCAALAAPEQKIIEVATGANGAGQTSDKTVRGYIDQIVLELPAGGVRTGLVSVIATPTIGAAVTLASATITSTTLVRPRFYETSIAGAAVDTASTNAASWRYMAWGDIITVTVTNANPTNVTWRVGIKQDYQK